MAAGGLVTITVPTSGGAGTIPTVDYTAEIALIKTQIDKLTATLVKTNLSLAGIVTSLAAIEAVLIAVQTPTGDFRTKDVSVTTDNALVNLALAKSAIPPPENTGI